MATQPLIINEWAEAIGQSPSAGIALLKNASIDSVPGCIMPNYAPAQVNIASATSTGSFNNGAGTFDLTTSGTSLEVDGVAVTFSTAGGGTLDTAITAGTVYFLYKFATGRVIIASTLGNALGHSSLSLNGNGSGTVTVTTVNMGTPNSIAQGIAPGGTSLTFVADSNGRVWYAEGDNGTGYLLNGNTITNGTGHGLALFTNSDASNMYLFVYRNAVIDVCNVTTQAKRRDPVGTSSWSSAWQTMNSASGYTGSHQAILGLDNIVYSCDGRYINSIQEIPGSVFAPGSSATYTWNSKALTLPTNDTANCLEQLNVSLLVGGLSTNLVYPWNRSDPSFGIPLQCPENGVYGMKNIGNTVWILNGQRGNVYKTTGYIVEFAAKLPESLTQSTSAGSNVVSYGGVAAKNGSFIFGALPLNTTNAGIWLVYPDGRIVIENTPSQGAVLPTVLGQTTGEFYYIGSAGMLDFISTSRYSTLGSVVFQSRLYNIGTKVGKATFSLLEVQLEQPGAIGGQVRVSYRRGVSGSFTVIDTYTLDGTSDSFDTDCGLIDIENIQVQVEVTGSGNGTNANIVREVRLLP